VERIVIATLSAVMPLLKKMEGLLIETKTDTTVIKKMKKVTRENIRRRYKIEAF
jgi:hypothetical protein